MRSRTAWLGLAIFFVLGVASTRCSLPVNGSGAAEAEEAGGDGGIDADTGVVEAAPEAAPCTSGVICNGQCMQANDCSACAGATLLCAPLGVCTADCSACHDANDKAMPIECYACDANHANPQGTCQYDDTSQYCLSGNYAAAGPTGGFRCICGDAGVSACPGATQVCAPTPSGVNLCITCGEIYLTDVTGQPCKDGKTCSVATQSCE